MEAFVDEASAGLAPAGTALENGIASIEFSTRKTVLGFQKAFKVWPWYLFQAVAVHFFRAPLAMEWITRGGTRIGILPRDESWFGAIENFGLDVYAFGSLDSFGADNRGVFVDLGANIGTSTLALLEHFPDARCYAYEPGARAFAQLHDNVAANGYGEQVTCRRAAVLGKPPAAEVDFFESTISSATSGVLIRENGLADRCTKSRVPAISFEDVLSDVGGEVDLLKIDVEGTEYDIFLATPAECWRRVRRLVLEYHPGPGMSWRDLRRLVVNAGFAIQAQARCNGSDDFGFLWCVNRTQAST